MKYSTSSLTVLLLSCFLCMGLNANSIDEEKWDVEELNGYYHMGPMGGYIQYEGGREIRLDDQNGTVTIETGQDSDNCMCNYLSERPVPKPCSKKKRRR